MAVEGCHLFDPEACRGRLHLNKIANKCTTTKARASLPDILELKSTESRTGVFTKQPLSQATQFGPLEAPLVSKQEVEDSTFLIKLDIHKCRRLENADATYIYYDTSDENVCNWFMFVQPAKSFDEQNLCAYQEGEFIYFVATRDVPAGEELKVWYSPTYAKFMSVSVLTPTSGVVSMPKVSNRKRRPGKLKTSRRMQIYPNSMLSERDVRSVPPKKRGWRRAKEKTDCNVRSSAIAFQGQVNYRGARLGTVKRFICPICQKAFKTNSKLKIHSVIHSSQCNFLCHFCGSTFKRKDKLRDHEKKMHSSDGIPKQKQKLSVSLKNFDFKCQECQIGFFRRGMLVNHLLKKHPETRANSIKELTQPLYKVVRDFLCPYCDKVYKSSTKRKFHILKQHPGRELPASVKKLNDPFSAGAAHNTITKETVTVTPFFCDHCERQYSTKHKRNKHMKEKHSEVKSGVIAQQETCSGAISQIYSVDHAAFQTIATQPIVNSIAEDASSASSHAGNATMYQMNQLSDTSHTVHSEVFCPQGTNPQTLTSELTATDRDLLNQAMCALEPVTTSAQPSHQYSGYQNAPPKGSSYSRYPLGRKRMLKTYEDSQNQLLAQSVPNVPPQQPQPEKQLPYKARLLNNEWRNVNWQDGHCGTTAITEVRQPPHSNNHGFPPVLNQQQTLVSMLGPPVNDGPMLLSDARPASSDSHVLNEHDVSDLVNAYESADSTHWMFPTTYESLSDSYATR